MYGREGSSAFDAWTAPGSFLVKSPNPIRKYTLNQIPCRVRSEQKIPDTQPIISCIGSGTRFVVSHAYSPKSTG